MLPLGRAKSKLHVAGCFRFCDFGLGLAFSRAAQAPSKNLAWEPESSGAGAMESVVAQRAAKRRRLTLCDEQKRTQTESPSSVKRDISEGFKQKMKLERQLESGEIWKMEVDDLWWQVKQEIKAEMEQDTMSFQYEDGSPRTEVKVKKRFPPRMAI